MNLALDIGNTRIKWGLFDGDTLVRQGTAERDRLAPLAGELPWRRAAVCASGIADLTPLEATGRQVLRLSHSTPMPINLDYATPHTLGADRIAAACGAWSVCGGSHCVVIDAGTCITIDYLDDAGCYHGGAILPGFEMKFRALHTFTARLPLLPSVDGRNNIVTGRDTAQSIEAGVVTATRFAVEGFVRHYRTGCDAVRVLLTGGDAARLVASGMDELPNATVLPNLVLTGLNTILHENEQ